MSVPTARDARTQLIAMADPRDAEHLSRFFKTGPGEYGEDDVFLGVRVPTIRKLVPAYRAMPLAEVVRLLQSEEHEARALALFILVEQYKRGDQSQKQAVFDAYIENTRYINNWDLVDSSAAQIVGAHLENRSKALLTGFAKSELLWERRIAMIATLAFIRVGSFDETVRIAKLLLSDDHDLIHKAVGWMLREMGQRDEARLRAFLREHAHRMPRTALRYAIEKFSVDERKRWLEA